MTFASPAAFWLLLFVPILIAMAYGERERRRRRLAKLGDARLLSSLARGASLTRRFRLRLLAILAYAFLVAALAGPQFGESTEVLPRRGLDVVFAVDVSRSMRARDVQPDRLERAKAEISAVLDKIGENRIGLIAFAGTAIVHCPLTTDKEAVRLFLRSLAPENAPQGGTAISAGVQAALNLFNAEEENDPRIKNSGRLLVMITDGEDHEGNVEQVAQKLKEKNISTMVIGVGGQLGEPIPIIDENGQINSYVRDRSGETVMTRLEPKTLQTLAMTSGGAYIDGASSPDLGMTDVETKVNGLEKRDLEARLRTSYVDRSRWPAFAALICIVLAVLIPERRRTGA